MRAVLLVEGASDRAAVETIARRRGLNLAALGVSVLPMGGATNIRRFLERFGPAGADLAVAGLYDRGEQRFFRRALESLGHRPPDGSEALAELGFFMCDRDLEDEMIRAIGPAGVLEVIESQGEMWALRVMQNQPAHRGTPTRDQLRRFMSTKSGRKIRYGRILAEAVPAGRIPQPLLRSLDRLTGPVAAR